MSRDSAVFGIYQSRAGAEKAIDALQVEGFRHEDVSVLFSSPDATQDFAVKNSTKAPEGATAGAVTGATVGGVLGWLAGIGSLAIPGVGPLIAAGPIMGALAGLGVGGAVGGMTGALVGLGMSEYEANRYEGKIKEGGVLVSVHVDDSDWSAKARHILERTGAEDISSQSEVRAS